MVYCCPPEQKVDVLGKITGALNLLFFNAKCSLMIPTNFAFGFAASFITSYIQGSVVAPVPDIDDDDELTDKEAGHSSSVLLYSSLAVGTATILAIPFNKLREKVSPCGGSTFRAFALAYKCQAIDRVCARPVLAWCPPARNEPRHVHRRRGLRCCASPVSPDLALRPSPCKSILLQVPPGVSATTTVHHSCLALVRCGCLLTLHSSFGSCTSFTAWDAASGRVR